MIRQSRNGACFAWLFWTAAIVGFVFGIGAAGDPEMSRGGRLVAYGVVLATIALGVFAWRWKRVGVSVENSTVVVRTPLRTSRLPIARVREVGVIGNSQKPRLFVQTSERRVVLRGLAYPDDLHAAMLRLQKLVSTCSDAPRAIDTTRGDTLVHRPAALTVIGTVLTVAVLVISTWMRVTANVVLIVPTLVLAAAGSSAWRVRIPPTTRESSFAR